MKEWRISDIYQTFFESVKLVFSTVLHLKLCLAALWSTLRGNLKQVSCIYALKLYALNAPALKYDFTFEVKLAKVS